MIAGDNWEDKVSNVAGIVGSVAPWLGPVGDMVGGVADLVSAGAGALGDYEDTKKDDAKEGAVASRPPVAVASHDTAGSLGEYSSTQATTAPTMAAPGSF